jgi:ATP-dependent protease HslVU (ClpYQ) ATPase subunit
VTLALLVSLMLGQGYAPQRQGQTVSIDEAQVEQRLGALARNEDLSRFVL